MRKKTKEHRFKVSVVIATYNSEMLLPMVMKAIEKQSIPGKDLEIIIVDGGSKDNTLQIAKQHNCRVVNNPKTVPVYGKYLAFVKTRGKYVMYLDHDEVLVNKNSIENKVETLEKWEEAKVVAGGNYVNPNNYPFINNYINEFGDPFTFFIYRLSKRNRFFMRSMKKRYRVLKQSENAVLFDLKEVLPLPIFELIAGGSMFDGDYLKKNFPITLKDYKITPHYYYLLYEKYQTVVIMKNDPIKHYSSDTLKRYLVKIAWRVKNNIYHIDEMGESGFIGREKRTLGNKYKKYLFIPYAFSLVLPLFDAILLMITRRDWRYILHVFLVEYTAAVICEHKLLKIFGVNNVLRNYDNSVMVRSDK